MCMFMLPTQTELVCSSCLVCQGSVSMCYTMFACTSRLHRCHGVSALRCMWGHLHSCYQHPWCAKPQRMPLHVAHTRIVLCTLTGKCVAVSVHVCLLRQVALHRVTFSSEASLGAAHLPCCLSSTVLLEPEVMHDAV